MAVLDEICWGFSLSFQIELNEVMLLLVLSFCFTDDLKDEVCVRFDNW